MLHSTIITNKTRNTVHGISPRHTRLDVEALNARSIALSVLLGSHPPELPARALVGLAELFGIPGGTMRTALSRLVAAGELQAADGRYRLVGRLLERQNAQDIGRRAATTGWTGEWHTIVTLDAQRELASRRRLRSTMANRRFGELRPDIWMRPANLRAPAGAVDADGDHPDHRTRLAVTTGPLTGIDHLELARGLWDLDEIAVHAERLVERLQSARTSARWDEPSEIPALFTLSATVVRFLRNDPLLPAELTPANWPVERLREVYDPFEADHQVLLRTFLSTT